jgi:hypothetical protein
VTTHLDPQDIETERLIALGLVIEWSAGMESSLRSTFCSLVGSKYAAVLAGGQAAETLIEDCLALLGANREIADAHKAAIKTALMQCREANKRRNVLVHGIKTPSGAADGSLRTLRSRRRSHLPDSEPWTPADIRAAATALAGASQALRRAMYAAVSPQLMVIGEALAWEELRAGTAKPGQP